MLSSQKMLGSILVLIFALLGQSLTIAMSSGEAVDLIAGRLEQEQIKNGAEAGLWPSEVLFTGPIVTGMASAYEWTADPAYRAAAELAGDYVLEAGIAQGNLLGDEAYSFVWLSEISEDPSHNIWQNALVDFFLSPRKNHNEATTSEYLRAFDDLEPSTAVFYLAHYLVAADYVQDQDTDVYRQTLINHLCQVDNNASFPVMALGVATWALTTTGTAADRAIVAPGWVSSSYWDGLTVGDLPELLASHQVPEGEPFAGSFYWLLDHTDGGTGGVVAGYTEDAVFGTLGLIASASQNADGVNEEADASITAARDALLQGIDENGQVYGHLARQGDSYNTFAGEMLEVLWRIEQYLDRDIVDDTDATAEVPVDMQ